MNLQQIEKLTHDPHGVIDIHHIFRTIQGEGPHAGTPAVFIRMAGCNLQCPLCDTDYTSHRMVMSPGSIVDEVNNLTRGLKYDSLVVITGGEPFRQNIAPAVEELLNVGYRVQIETNGTLWVKDLLVDHENFDIVCSPKTGKLDLNLAPHIGAFKYVLHADYVDPEDGLPTLALEHSANPRVARPPEEIFGGYDWGNFVYVQPADTFDIAENRRHTEAAISSCLKYGYTFCLQVQKSIGME